MLLNFKIKNFQKGITLIELIVVIFLVVLFSSITIYSLQRIQANLALSRSAYKLAQDFSEFYQKCPVLNVESELKYSRLNLVLAFSYVLKSTLSLLGINTLEKM